MPSDVLPARVNQHVAIIRPDPNRLAARYLRYLLVTPETQSMLLSWAGSGGTRNALTKGMIESFDIHAPANVTEQRVIAHVLGTLDDKIELNRRMNETLEAMARALFKSWFVDFDPVRAKMEGRDPGLPQPLVDLFPDRLIDSEIGGIPEGWAARTLGNLCLKPQYGYTASAKDHPVGPKFLRITDINKKAWIDWKSVPYCEASEGEFEKYRVHSGDVLIARMADPGHGVVIEEDLEAVFASYLIRFRPLEQRNTRIIQYWLQSQTYWNLVKGRCAGTTRVSLNAKVLGSFPLLVPADPIATAFARHIDQIRASVIANAAEMRTLATTRDTLLPRVISGEIRIREAERVVEAMA